MRVALTLEQCWHEVPGGTAVAALGMAGALVGRPGLELVGVSAWHRRPPAEPFVPPVPVRRLPLGRRLLYEAWRRLGHPAVERATGPVDVVHATTIIVPPARAALVVTLHDLAFLHDPASFTAHGIAAFTAGLERTKRHARLVLCSSQATMDDALAHGLEPDRLRLVPLGLDPVEVPGAEAVAAVRRALGLARPYLLFVGTLEPRKNLPRLLEAFSRLPADHDLVVAGPAGWGDVAPALSKGRHVRLVGFVDEPTKAALYAGADAVCYPSLREGFGLPVLEAMAHGAPVITSRATATAEVGGDAVVLVDPADVDDIARGITEALARREELAVAGRRQAARFRWEVTADRVAEAYREAAS